MSTEIDVGRRIAGKYELVRLLGKGAMGEVWLASHDSLGGDFAIKLVRPSDDIEDETAAGRFQLEAQVSAKLSRKTRHIVSVSDHGEEDGLAYIVMEVLDGESLEARLRRVGALPLPEVAAIVMQLARALGIAHSEGIFHRDLKPANVFLTKDEDGRLLVKILDFGIARTVKPMRTRSPFATGKDMVLGTPSYMSPEQARGLDTLDYRCDLWAMAVCAYEALTKEIPWEGDSVEDIFLSICTHRFVPILARRSDLPAEVEGIFARAFAQKLDDRFKSAQELTEAFESLVTVEEIEAAIGGTPRAPTSARRPPTPSNPSLPSAVVTPTPAGEMTMNPRSSDLLAVAVNDETVAGLKRKSNAGWLWATVGGVATVAIIVFLLMKFGRTTTSPVSSAPPPEVKPPPTQVVAPPAPSPSPDPTTASAPTTAAPDKPAPRARAKTTQPTPPPPATTTQAAPPPPPPPAPPPATAKPPAPRATHEKNEVL